MLQFKQYLKEAILRTDLSGSKKSVIKQFNSMSLGSTIDLYDKTKLFSHGKYTVYKEITGEGIDIFVVDKSKKIVIELILHKRDAMYYVDTVVSTAKDYKAHELYRDLLLSNVVGGLITHEQSPGGRQIWDKLSKFKDITVFGWDPYSRQPVNLGSHLPDEDETHISSDDDSFDRDDDLIRRMELVAIKKVKNIK